MAATISRREFVTRSAAVIGSSQISRLDFSEKIPADAGKKEDVMEEVLRYQKIDAHAHVGLNAQTPAEIIDIADRLGIGTLMISKPMKPGSAGTPDEFVACNNEVYQAMKTFPNRFIGMLTLNPTYPKESQEEITRCTALGMVGMKLYNHVKINDPLFYPVIEKFIDLKMIMLMHSPIGKSRVILDAREPRNVSLPEDFVDAARRYPEAMFQFAHIGGGIDWEDACKALQGSPNVYVDVSGSNNEGGMIDFAMRYIGEDRLLFGCDYSFYQSVGGMMAADLTELQRKKLFFENYQSILKKSGNYVN